MSDVFRVGVVGCSVGRQHVAAFESLPTRFQVTAVCDLDQAKAHAVATEFGVSRIAADMAEMCRIDDVDIIDICTPPHLHYEQTLQALAAGKHAICEKPVAGSLKQIDELIAAEAQSGKRIMPIFQYRFRSGLQKLKLLVDDGVAGRAYLTTVETAWRRRADYYVIPWRGKWRTELGGPMFTLAIHAHDVMTYILGPVRNVFARMATLVNPIETEDCVSASLEMGDGSLCSLSVTTGSAQPITRHRFCFSNLTAESNTRSYSNTSDPWTFTGDSPEAEQRIQAALARFQPLPEGFAGQFYRFYQAMHRQADKTELPVTLADARAAIDLVTAAYYSARTHQPVSLPTSRDHPYYTGWQP
jgi:predicted dehydrogenase